MIDRIKATICLGLVILGLALTVPWLGVIGWLALGLIGYL